jgi:hypothetical protein
MPGNVDWAFAATDASGDKGENADAAKSIRQEIESTTIWPEVDLLEHFT